MMKQLFIFLFLSISLHFGVITAQSLSNKTDFTKQTERLAQIKWETQDMDLGVIKFRQMKTVAFTFTNTGKNPLIITDVKTTCGCTVAEFPKEPIMPGQKGEIKAMYSAGTKGTFYKSLTVTANIPQHKIDLNIRGEVQ